MVCAAHCVTDYIVNMLLCFFVVQTDWKPQTWASHDNVHFPCFWLVEKWWTFLRRGADSLTLKGPLNNETRMAKLSACISCSRTSPNLVNKLPIFIPSNYLIDRVTKFMTLSTSLMKLKTLTIFTTLTMLMMSKTKMTVTMLTTMMILIIFWRGLIFVGLWKIQWKQFFFF